MDQGTQWTSAGDTSTWTSVKSQQRNHQRKCQQIWLQHTAPPDLRSLLLGFKPFQPSLKNTIILQVFYLFSVFVDDSGTVTSSAGTTCQAHTHHYSNSGVMRSCIECCAYFRDAEAPPPLREASVHHARVPAVIQSFNSYTAQASEVCLTLCCFSPPNHCCSESTTS